KARTATTAMDKVRMGGLAAARTISQLAATVSPIPDSIEAAPAMAATRNRVRAGSADHHRLLRASIWRRPERCGTVDRAEGAGPVRPADAACCGPPTAGSPEREAGSSGREDGSPDPEDGSPDSGVGFPGAVAVTEFP